MPSYCSAVGITPQGHLYQGHLLRRESLVMEQQLYCGSENSLWYHTWCRKAHIAIMRDMGKLLVKSCTLFRHITCLQCNLAADASWTNKNCKWRLFLECQCPWLADCPSQLASQGAAWHTYADTSVTSLLRLGDASLHYMMSPSKLGKEGG